MLKTLTKLAIVHIACETLWCYQWLICRETLYQNQQIHNQLDYKVEHFD